MRDADAHADAGPGKLTRAEWRRKALHAGMGFFALTLRWLDWRMAAALAVAALVFNLLAMPRIGRGGYRDPAKVHDSGIVAYPSMVLVLILLFRYELSAAAALWGMMAFGDPAATVVGRLLKGPRLPWNPKKTWSGLSAYVLVGTAAAAGLWLWTTAERTVRPDWGPLLVGLLVFSSLLPVVSLGALLESLDTGVDDNWIPPLPCALALALVIHGLDPFIPWRGHSPVRWELAALVNIVVAAATLGARLVSVSGAVAGACLGFVILACGGWPGYAILWTFFLVATAATKLGYARKQAAGTAQDARGRRGGRHAIANCGVGAALAVVVATATGGGQDEIRRIAVFALTGAFAAALADTLGTELGSLYGGTPVSVLARKSVPPGTPGAVSAAGLIGGLLGGGVIGVVASAVGLIPAWGIWVISIAGIAGSMAESLLADGARLGGRRIEHDFANAFNTFVGAVTAAEIAASLALGRIYVPFES